MKSLKLKPCPFCGTYGIRVETGYADDGKRFRVCIACYQCNSKSPEIIDDVLANAAIRARKSWNTRTSGWVSVEDELPEAPEVKHEAN